MKRLFLCSFAISLAFFPAVARAAVYDSALATRMHGRILLQVEEHGEAWYVRSKDSKRYYMKDGAAAYSIMRFFSQGITDADLAKIPHVSDTTEMKASSSACASNGLANRMRGQILLQVQQHGEAWYVDPVKCRAIYMKDGAVAYEVMRFLGLGILTSDLVKIEDGGAVAGGTVAVVPPPKPTTCSRTFSPKYSQGPQYTGALFDAHFHMPPAAQISLENLVCLFDKENVKGAVAFYMVPQTSLDASLAEAQTIQATGKIHPFILPVPISLRTLEDVQASHPGLFSGYGEMAFYSQNLSGENLVGQSPDAQRFLDVYALAGKNKRVVMIHPDAGQAAAVENMVQKNPSVKFYFHGDEIESAITGLMDKYPNVYYSIDVLLSRAPSSYGDALHTSMTKEEYVSKVGGNFNAILQRAVTDWKTKIERHPDRFTWGTDRGGPSWHYSEEVSLAVEELARVFIARLDPAVQEKFAHQNAEALLSLP